MRFQPRLGIAGTQSSTDPSQPLVGADVNPIQANGVFNLLVQLQSALSTSNNTELTNLSLLLQNELGRIGVVQANLGSREQMLSQVQTQLSTSANECAVGSVDPNGHKYGVGADAARPTADVAAGGPANDGNRNADEHFQLSVSWPRGLILST